MFTNYYMATQSNVSTSHSRYERKFFTPNLDRYEIESLIRLHPAAFSETYWERSVNNIYFDSFNMKSYFDNVFGAEKRVKVRIRWYGDLFGKIAKPALEFKIKEGLLCNKLSFPLNEFSIDTDFSIQMLRDVFDSFDIPEMLKFHLKCIEPTLFNTYRRRYYLSRDHRYRLTLDSNLEFLELSPFKNNFLSLIHI